MGWQWDGYGRTLTRKKRCFYAIINPILFTPFPGVFHQFMHAVMLHISQSYGGTYKNVFKVACHYTRDMV